MIHISLIYYIDTVLLLWNSECKETASEELLRFRMSYVGHDYVQFQGTALIMIILRCGLLEGTINSNGCNSVGR